MEDFKIEDLPFENMTPQERRIWWARCLVAVRQSIVEGDRQEYAESLRRKWQADPYNPAEMEQALQNQMSTMFRTSYSLDELKEAQERLRTLETGEAIGNDPGPEVLHEFVLVWYELGKLKEENQPSKG